MHYCTIQHLDPPTRIRYDNMAIRHVFSSLPQDIRTDVQFDTKRYGPCSVPTEEEKKTGNRYLKKGVTKYASSMHTSLARHAETF